MRIYISICSFSAKKKKNKTANKYYEHSLLHYNLNIEIHSKYSPSSYLKWLLLKLFLPIVFFISVMIIKRKQDREENAVKACIFTNYSEVTFSII